MRWLGSSPYFERSRGCISSLFGFFAPFSAAVVACRQLKAILFTHFCVIRHCQSFQAATECKLVNTFLRRPPLFATGGRQLKLVCSHTSALTSAIPASRQDILPASKNAFSGCNYILMNICNLKRQLIYLFVFSRRSNSSWAAFPYI